MNNDTIPLTDLNVWKEIITAAAISPLGIIALMSLIVGLIVYTLILKNKKVWTQLTALVLLMVFFSGLVVAAIYNAKPVVQTVKAEQVPSIAARLAHNSPVPVSKSVVKASANSPSPAHEAALVASTPVPETVVAPAPVPEALVASTPVPETVVAPAPVPETVVAPAPVPEALVAPTPVPEALVAPTPVPEALVAPTPVPETVVAPAPVHEAVVAAVPTNCGTHLTEWIDVGSAVGNPCPQGCTRGDELSQSYRVVGFPPRPQVQHNFQCWVSTR